MDERSPPSLKPKPPSPYWWVLIFPLGVASLVDCGAAESSWPMLLGLLAFVGLAVYMTPRKKVALPSQGMPQRLSPYWWLLLLPAGSLAGSMSIEYGEWVFDAFACFTMALIAFMLWRR